MIIRLYEVSEKAKDNLNLFDAIITKSKISGLYSVELECTEVKVLENHIEIWYIPKFEKYTKEYFSHRNLAVIGKDEFSELVI